MKSLSLLVKTVLLGTLLLSACGYKPSSKYAKEVLGNSISTKVIISMEDPENSVVVKDAVDTAVVQVFQANLTDKKSALTHLNISLSEPTYTPVQYDNNGYVVGYRATVVLSILRSSKDIKKMYSSKGSYDFSVVPNAVLSDKERFDAIKFSSIKAISAFVAKVSAEGSRVK